MTATVSSTQSAAVGVPGARLDVLVIGAGFSGVCAGIRLLGSGIHNFRIVEKSEGIGGTWYNNTYPGAACDVPSHFYCFSFEPNSDWSRVYSPQSEIQRYIEHCVDKFGLRSHIVHGARVSEMHLEKQRGCWMVTLADGSTVEALHIINGSGGLHKPKIPKFRGRELFSGHIMHTAEWDHSVDFRGKRVAIIGSAASAIQVIPELAPIVKSLNVFQRTPNYIAPRRDREYTDREKARFARWPLFQRVYRWLIYKRMDLLLFPVTKKGSNAGKTGADRIMQYMRASVRDTGLHGALEPDYQMGCKRILLSDDLYETLNRDNVELETRGIQGIERTGIRSSDGRLIEADIIVLATGFDIEAHMRSIKVTGENGAALDDVWRDGPEAYCGCCVSGFPNYWMVTGPNTGVGTTSVVFMIEQTVDLIMRLIAMSGGRMLGIKQAVQDRYNADIRAALDETVWASGCDSYYISGNGRITTLYPHNAAAFRRQLARVAERDFYAIGSPPTEKAA